jgi:hypothetical protein
MQREAVPNSKAAEVCLFLGVKLGAVTEQILGAYPKENHVANLGELLQRLHCENCRQNN